jgi:hypothetical protein
MPLVNHFSLQILRVFNLLLVCRPLQRRNTWWVLSCQDKFKLVLLAPEYDFPEVLLHIESVCGLKSPC